MSIYQLEREGDAVGLANALSDADLPEIRRQAAKALVGLDLADDLRDAQAEQVRLALESAVLSDPDDRVRAIAVDAVEEWGLDELRRVLATAMGTDPEAIGLKAFRRILDHDRAEFRMIGLAGVRQIDNDTLTKAAVSRIRDPDPRVRERAVRTCAHNDIPNCERIVMEALDDPNGQVRAAAATVLGDLESTAAVSQLAEKAVNDIETVRLAAIDALGSIGSPAAVGAISAGLGDANPSISRLSVFALIELMANASSDQSHQVRERVLAVASETARSTVVDTLVELLDTMSEEGPRRNAVWLLGQLATDRPTEEAVEALIDQLDADDDQTIQLATTALAGCPSHRVEPPLLDLLASTTSTAMQSRIIYVLGRAGSGRSIRHLERLAEETADPNLRERTVEAIQRLEAQQSRGGDDR